MSRAPQHLESVPAEMAWRELVVSVRGVIGVARALAERGRPVDLAGLADMVGVVCAKALDLPAGSAASARPMLAALDAELAMLGAILGGAMRS